MANATTFFLANENSSTVLPPYNYTVGTTNGTFSHSVLWSTVTPSGPSRSLPAPTDPYVKLALYILMGLVAVVGIIGNVCVCFIVIRGKKMYTIANLFLMNLALADIFVLSICYPLSIIRNEMSWPFGEVLCKILPSLSDSFYGVSMGCITAIAIYRYRMILHSMTTHMSFTHAKITLVIIWVLALCVISVPLCWILKLKTYRIPVFVPSAESASNALNISYYPKPNSSFLDTQDFPVNFGLNSSANPQGYLANTTDKNQSTSANPRQRYITIRKCTSQWPPRFRKIYQIVQISWYVLPLSVILFTYLRIRTYLKKTLRYEWTKTGENSTPQSGLTNRVIGIKRALTLLAPVVVTFAVLMFPWNLLRFLSLVMNLSEIEHIYTYLDIAAAMMIANSCSNPFIYYIMSKDFRDEFRRHFRQFTKCYKSGRDSATSGRRLLRSVSSFKTREETIAADEVKTERNSLVKRTSNADNVFNSSWEKYAVRQVDSPFPTWHEKPSATSKEPEAPNESAKLLESEPVYDPDRETII
eukprot:gene13113-3901_t